MPTYRIRPHHGLCIQFFIGKGYSDAFVSNMSQVIDKLNQDATIQLITENDIICSACPSNLGNQCATQSKVSFYDKKVLELCHLHPNDEISAKDFFQLVKTNILDSNQLEQVCSDCEWYSICKNNIS